MRKLQKGQKGYIKSRKNRYLAWALSEFGVVAGLFIIGYVQTKTRLNLLTVVAIVGCLPASKMLVEFITMAPYKSISEEKYQEIEEKGALLTRAYDMVITSKESVMPVTAVAISGHMVCGYAQSEKVDEVRCARYIKEMLESNKYDKMTVKIFRDYHAFLSRVEGMNNIAKVEQPENRRTEKKVKRLILSISM